MAGSSFKASRSMRRYAAACADPDIEASPEARCAAASVTAAQVVRWWKRPEFGEWLGEEVRRLLAARMWEVWAVVFREARDGNLTAAKLLTDRLTPEVRNDDNSPSTFEELARLAQAYESDINGGNQP